MTPKVSVIVPVYNVENYIRPCLDSIQAQTLREIEILCIDDGSTDSCPRILDEYAANDPRFVVIHKLNEGYGKAINTGCDAASGKYIGIVESDDMILPEMYETLFRAAEENELDLVKSDYMELRGAHSSVFRRDDLGRFYNRTLTPGERMYMFAFPKRNWTGIFRLNFLRTNGIRHNETPGASFQDTGFWFQTLSMAERAMWLDRAFYLYRLDNPDASMKSVGKMLADKGEFDFIEEILRAKGLTEELKLCAYFRLVAHHYTFLRISDTLRREYADIIIEEYRKYRPQVPPECFYWHPGLFRWLDRLAADPVAVCREAMEKVQETRGRLEHMPSLIVYGTGKTAQSWMPRLFDLGYYDRIVCAAESGPPSKEMFWNLPVRQIDELLSCRDTAQVLVMAARNNGSYFEIENRLRELGFQNYVDFGELNLEYFAFP